SLERVIGLPYRRRGEGVRRRDICAGLEVRVVDLRDDLRRRQVEEVRIALDVVRVVAEARAAVLLLRESAPVDKDAPGPVEHDDALGKKGFELCADVLHEIGSRLKRSGAGGPRAL